MMKQILLFLLLLPFKIIGMALDGGTADESEQEFETTYKPKGENGEMVQVYEIREKKGFF